MIKLFTIQKSGFKKKAMLGLVFEQCDYRPQKPMLACAFVLLNTHQIADQVNTFLKSDKQDILKVHHHSHNILRGKSLVSNFDQPDYYNAQPLALDPLLH